MKTFIFHKVMSGIMILSFITNTTAQNAIDKYRITAYQKGSNQVTSLSNEVEIAPAAVLYAPNAFTPNGDGLNDTFGHVGEGIAEYNLQIFDRWGNLIFESNNMENQWDGTYKNEMAPMGVYVYKVTASGSGTNGKTKRLINENGSVTLVI